MVIWSYDRMIVWSYDHMIIWSHDNMIIWSYDRMIVWSYDHIIIWSYDHMMAWSYHMIIWSYVRPKIQKQIGFRVERWNVGDRLKRILTKFHADRSYRRGVKDRSKFAKIWHFRLRKIKCRGSSETRFGQVWRRSELCLRGKWPFKVSEMKRTNCTNSAHRPDPWLI